MALEPPSPGIGPIACDLQRSVNILILQLDAAADYPMTPSGRSPTRKRRIRERYVAQKGARYRYARITMMPQVDPEQQYWNPSVKKDVYDFNHCVRDIFAAEPDVQECHPQNKISFAGLRSPQFVPDA